MMEGKRRKVMMKIAFVLIFSLLSFSMMMVKTSEGANLNCSIMPKGDCTGGTKLLYLRNDTGGYSNAHAQNASMGDYPYAICCDANALGDTITTGCEDATFLKLSNVTNAHVEQPGAGSYATSACISANTGRISCNYPSGDCTATYECLASMASSGTDQTTNAHVGDCGEYATSVCCGLGSAPNNPTPILNSSNPSLNRTAQNLECSFKPLTIDPGTLYANITWFNNSLAVVTNRSITVTNGTQFVDILDDEYTKKEQNWTCSVQICSADGLCSNWVNSSNLRILNTPPAAPTLSTPGTGNITFDLTPTLTWGAASDEDGDSLTYGLFLDCLPACSSDDREVSSIAGLTYTIPNDLRYYLDDGDYYNWTINAYDNVNYGANATPRNFSVQSEVVITLADSFVNFATMNLGQTEDTSDNTPTPFSIRNDGNCYVDTNLSATRMLWETQPNPSSYFQYKIDNKTGEAGAFNWSSSITSWTNIPVSNITAINWLNYTDATDSAEIDIKIEVPLDEPATSKSGMLQFTGRYAKVT